jgi:tetratricopeptide (TPR) repeat protein
MPRGTLAVLTLLLALLAAAPAGAREEKAKQDCLDQDLKAEDRITACTRYLRGGRPEAAEKVAILMARARAYRDSKQYDLAIADLNEALTIAPDDAELYQQRGLVYDWQGNEEAALADYEKAIELDPGDAWSHYARGMALKQLGRLDVALKAFEDALAISPNYVSAIRGHADANVKLKDWRAARDDFGKLVHLEPYDDYYWEKRGEMNLRSFAPANAAHDLLVAWRLNPNSDNGQWLIDGLGIDKHRSQPTIAWDRPYVPPRDGLVITYLQQEVTPASQVEVDPMEEAIGDLVGFFGGPAKVDPPISSLFVTRRITGADGDRVMLAGDVTFPGLDSPGLLKDRASSYYFGIWPANFSTPQGDGAVLDYGANLSAIWSLAPGQGTQDEGSVVVHCPAEGVQPDLLATMVGCQPGETVTIGSIDWSARVEGWDVILTPAGRFPALKIVYQESATMTLMGQTRTRDQTVTWWWSPDVRFWVKSKVEKDGHILVTEAVAIGSALP